MNHTVITKLASAIHESDSGVWSREKDGLLYFHSRYFYRQFGLPSYPIDTKAWLDLIHPDDVQEIKKTISEHVTKRYEIGKSCYRVRNVQGNYVLIESTDILYNNGEQDFFIGRHKVLSADESKKQRNSITGLRNKNTLKYQLKCTALRQAQAFLISSDKVEHRSHLLGTAITRELADLVELAVEKCGLADAEIFSITNSHLIVKSAQIGEVDIARKMAQSLICSCDSAEYITREELTLTQFPMSLIHTINDIESFSINVSNYASTKQSGKLLILDELKYDRIHRQIKIQQALKSAIVNREFNIAVQPIVEAENLELFSTEVLARWTHASLGVVRPDEFIPVIEQLGYTTEFGWMIFEKSCQYLTNHRNFRININVSVKFLKSRSFVQTALAYIEQYQLNPNQFYLEVTESFPIDDEPELIEKLEALKQRGFNLSLDDFGAGYSSLLAAFNLPFSQIKIDKHLIFGIEDNKNYTYLLEFLGKVAKERKIQLVAEGIETDKHIDITRKLGIELLQGYRIARPKIIDVFR